MLHSICQQFRKFSSDHRTGKGQYSFQSQRAAMQKQAQYTEQLHWSHTLVEEGNGNHSSTLAWKVHGWRSLVGCSPWGRKELDTTERLHFHFSLSCIGEGNGNPLQCSCLESSRDGGAWWAAVYGVTQSRTWLKWFSSSGGSSSRKKWHFLYFCRTVMWKRMQMDSRRQK